MRYDFDTIIERKGTGAVKFDFSLQKGVPDDAMSLWVADMDFPSPLPVREELKRLSEFGIFGYTDSGDDYFRAVSKWFKDHFGWEVRKEWLVKTPGVVFAIASAVRAFSAPGDEVLIQEPVYYPFAGVINANGRKVVSSDLIDRDGHYEMDFPDLEKKLSRKELSVFILCSPHNPVGRVWTREELIRVEELCLKYDVMVISDEIHCDFVWGDNVHTVLSGIDERYRKNVITCTAPSKTFNLAGMQLSNIFIPDRENRKKFRKAITETGSGSFNIMGLAACRAAYEEGEEWLIQVRKYIRNNIDFMQEFIKERIPGVKAYETEGTYLVWVDFRGLGITNNEINDLVLKKAGLWLDAGDLFGKPGEGFQRINAACPRKYLEEALIRLENAVKEL